MGSKPGAGRVAVDRGLAAVVLRVLVPGCIPIDFSAARGPCGRPDGCSVIDPTSTASREPKFPET